MTLGTTNVVAAMTVNKSSCVMKSKVEAVLILNKPLSAMVTSVYEEIFHESRYPMYMVLYTFRSTNMSMERERKRIASK